MVMRNLIDFQIMGCEQRPVALALIAMRYPIEAIGSHWKPFTDVKPTTLNPVKAQIIILILMKGNWLEVRAEWEVFL